MVLPPQLLAGTHSTPETPHPVVSSPLESLEGDATSSSIPVQQPVASWKTRLAPPSLLSMPLHTQHSALVPPTLAPESVGNNSGDSNTCPSAAPTHDMAQEAGVATGGSGCMHSEPQADSVSRVMKRGSTPSPTSVQVSYDAVMARSGQHLTDFDVLFGHGLFSPHSTAPTTHTAHRVAAGTATTTATATGTGAATGAGTGTGMCGITASGSSSNLNLEGLECGICLAPLLDEDDEDPDGLGSRGGGEQFVAPGAPTSTLLAMPCCHCLVHLACISRCLELRAIRKCCCVCQRHFTTELTEAVADQEASQRSAAKRARGRLLSGVGELGVHSVFQPRRASRRASSVPKHAK